MDVTPASVLFAPTVIGSLSSGAVVVLLKFGEAIKEQ
jgi:hypothetical protein